MPVKGEAKAQWIYIKPPPKWYKKIQSKNSQLIINLEYSNTEKKHIYKVIIEIWIKYVTIKKWPSQFFKYGFE